MTIAERLKAIDLDLKIGKTDPGYALDYLKFYQHTKFLRNLVTAYRNVAIVYAKQAWTDPSLEILDKRAEAELSTLEARK